MCARWNRIGAIAGGLAAAMVISTPSLSADAFPVSWAGPYAGASVQGIQSDGQANLSAYSGDLIVLDVSNGLFPREIGKTRVRPAAGLTLGYNRQDGHLVTGLQLDLSLANATFRSDFSRVDPNPDPIFNGVHTNTSYTTELDGLATAQVRAGYATGSWLFYASGGLAAGSVQNRVKLDIPELGYASPDWSKSGTLFGYTLGAGVERQINARVSVKAELARYDLRDVTVTGTDPDSFPGQELRYRFENDGVVARIGFNVRF